MRVRTLITLGASLIWPFSGIAQDQKIEINELLANVSRKYGLPGMAAAVTLQGNIVASGVVGLRKQGSPEAIQLGDRWHLGSDGKSFTATLAAMLVADGKIAWSSTIVEVLPEFGETMNPAWREVTLEQLLTHRSGLGETPPDDLWTAARKQTGTAQEQRAAFDRGLLAQPPEYPPGSRFVYTNQGYAVAGRMLERVGGASYEDLILERICRPLGLTSAGFGAPGKAGKVDEPWGHLLTKGILQPVEPGPAADNPPAISPAGRLHLSIEDFARYAAWQSTGERVGAIELSKEGFKKIHTTPPGQDQAMGWIVADREWAGGKTLSHAGSNTMWFALVWVAPAKDATFVVATNAALPNTFDACDNVIAHLIETYLTP